MNVYLKPPWNRVLVPAAILLLLPMHTAANRLKGEVDTLYRPIESRLLKLGTMLPPQRDSDGKESTARQDSNGCPDSVSIGGLEKKEGGSVFKFEPKIYIDGPLVIDCRR